MGVVWGIGNRRIIVGNFDISIIFTILEKLKILKIIF